MCKSVSFQPALAVPSKKWLQLASQHQKTSVPFPKVTQHVYAYGPKTGLAFLRFLGWGGAEVGWGCSRHLHLLDVSFLLR